MKLFIIRDPQSEYDEYRGFAVVAVTPLGARALVAGTHGDLWLDPARTTCVEVDLTLPGIAMTDFHDG